jgi:Rrf2 family protein
MPSSRFSVAVHTLSILAHRAEEPVSSDVIAQSVNTNPVVIRKLIARLRRARLVKSRSGRGGGLSLAREPRKISLMDIYNAVEGRELIPVHDETSRHCEVGREVTQVLERYTSAAEEAMAVYLRGITLSDVIADIRSRLGANCRR